MIDSHIHLLKLEDEGYNSPDEISANIRRYWSQVHSTEVKRLIYELEIEIKKQGFKKAILYMLDDEWYNNKWFPIKSTQNINIAMAINPFCSDLEDKLDILQKNDIKIVKVLPYEQKIMSKDYQAVLELAKKIEEKNMVLTVCCSYGSRYVYNTNGVELVSYLLNHGVKSPIIMAHGGMVKIFDAMSLMLEFSNLYMDISFTIPYWWGSSIIGDYAFAFEKLSYDRIFYGSDAPYVGMKKSHEYFKMFCEKYEVSEEDITKILSCNFEMFSGKFL